jgi:hypothetical protein
VAAIALGCGVWCSQASAHLPPRPQAELDANVTIEGTVIAITHTDRDLEPEPRALGGRRRIDRTLNVMVRIEKTVTGNDPATAAPPSGAFVLVLGTELIGPATEGGVDEIGQLRKGTRARFHLERREDGAWSIIVPNGLVPLDQCESRSPTRADANAAVAVEGTVIAITHTDRSVQPGPGEATEGRPPGGVRERIFEMTVRVERTLQGRDRAALPSPTEDYLVVRAVETIVPANEGAAHPLDEVHNGTKARFHLARRDDDETFTLAPDGLLMLGDCERPMPIQRPVN